jgi:hypothetical protein
VFKYAQSTLSTTTTGATVTFCPNGPMPNAMPPQCIVEVDFGNASLTLTNGPVDGGVQEIDLTGTIPLRLADMPVSATTILGPFSGDATINAGAVCPVSTTESFAVLDVQAKLTESGSAPVIVGCSPLGVLSVTLTASQVQGDSNVCGVPSQFVSLGEAAFSQLITTVLQDIIAQGITSQACLH